MEMSTTNDKICLNDWVYATKRKQGVYVVTFYNGLDMGTLEKDVDGYYKYWPTKREGFWEASLMRAVADLLDHVNAEWDVQVKRL